jgi:Septum formation
VNLRRAAVLLASLALAVSACTSSGDRTEPAPSRSAKATTSPSASTSPAPVVPPAPQARGCYRLTVAQLAKPTNASTPVSCHARHTTQTVYVGTLDTVVDGHAIAVDSDRVQRQLERTCPAKLAAYLGGTVEERDLSRFRVVWFSPTLQQSDQGADWFRCDAIAFTKGEALFPLPPPRRLHRLLDHGDALSTYGLCGTSAPGTKGFDRVVCGRRHSWKATATIPIAGGRRYPGVAAVRGAGDASCKAKARERSGNSLKYSYGWEWPTREQWTGGQHYGFCWVPD